VRLFLFVRWLLDVLIKIKAQAVETFVSNREIWEDKIAGRSGTIEVGHAGDSNASENRAYGLALNAAMGHWTSPFEGGKEEEAGIMVDRDVSRVRAIEFGLYDVQLNDRRRVDRPTVGRGWDRSVNDSALWFYHFEPLTLGTSSAGSGLGGLLKHFEGVGDLPAILGEAVEALFGDLCAGLGECWRHDGVSC
jgi:hypothetical protein